MKNRRLHWSWSIPIAITASVAYAFINAHLLRFEERSLHKSIVRAGNALFGSLWGEWIAFFMFWQLPVVLLTLATVAILARFFWHQAEPDIETRCRRCDHILRGLSAPRCPECGESI